MAHENALEFIVKELKADSQRTSSRDQIINMVISNVTLMENELKSIGLIANSESYEKITFRDIYEKIKNAVQTESTFVEGLYRWANQSISEPELIDRIQSKNLGIVSLIPIVWLIAYFRLKDGIDKDSRTINLLSRGGWGRVGLKEVIFPIIKEWEQKDPLYSQVVGELIGRTVDQHVRIAWSRMATDIKKDVSVLSVDGDKWKYKKDFVSGRTASRLTEATGWLRQLKLINNNGITSDGKEILKRGYASLNKYYSDPTNESA